MFTKFFCLAFLIGSITSTSINAHVGHNSNLLPNSARQLLNSHQTGHLRALHSSLAHTRRSVQEQEDAVSVPTQELRSILDQIRELEAEVEALLSKAGNQNADTVSNKNSNLNATDDVTDAVPLLDNTQGLPVAGEPKVNAVAGAAASWQAHVVAPSTNASAMSTRPSMGSSPDQPAAVFKESQPSNIITNAAEDEEVEGLEDEGEEVTEEETTTTVTSTKLSTTTITVARTSPPLPPFPRPTAAPFAANGTVASSGKFHVAPVAAAIPMTTAANSNSTTRLSSSSVAVEGKEDEEGTKPIGLGKVGNISMPDARNLAKTKITVPLERTGFATVTTGRS